MTEQNKKLNLKEELLRSDEAMQAYTVLAGSGLYKDAISRLYYALFHRIRAILLTKGLEPKTHDGALTLFSLHFVKAKLFIPGDAHVIARLMKFREEADYSSTYVLTEQDCNELHKEVEALSEKIVNYLMQNKFLP